MTTQTRAPYRYTACGLDNVLIYGMPPVKDDEGQEVRGVQNITTLHCAIACEIVFRESAMSGKELRFLRTEMGLTQAELAKLVHKETLTVGRWERGETPIDANADTLVRLLAIEKLKLTPKVSTAELAGYSVPTAAPQLIELDGSDPQNYRPLAA